MNITDISDISKRTIEGILTGAIKPEQASAIAGILKQNIAAYRLALDYARLKGGERNIPALEVSSGGRGIKARFLEWISTIPEDQKFTIGDAAPIIERFGFSAQTASAALLTICKEGYITRLPKSESQRDNIYCKSPSFTELYRKNPQAE